MQGMCQWLGKGDVSGESCCFTPGYKRRLPRQAVKQHAGTQFQQSFKRKRLLPKEAPNGPGLTQEVYRKRQNDTKSLSQPRFARPQQYAVKTFG